MLELVESLGLGGDDADDLVKGLGLSSKIPKPKFEITPAPAENTDAQAPQPEPDQGTTAATSALTESVGTSTATPGDEPSVTSESKTDQVDETPPLLKDSPAGAAGTQDPVQAATAASPVTQTDNTEVERPDGESKPKIVQGEIPANEGTRLPSATDDGAKEVAAAPGTGTV